MNATPQQMAARRYRIERYLTEGGMGAIYIGKKLGPGGFEKEVVLKQLLPEYTSRPEFRDLFFREAKISATLDHANIVHTFDLVESDESLFIVMEYVRGVDLRTIIRRAKLRRRELAPGGRAPHRARGAGRPRLRAHAPRRRTASSLAIIHRDVSPSNILCSAQGEVKLSDFGIAKASTHSSVFYRVRGKVGYMSPEQARNEPIDHRTDLYSVAVCLYEALTGERLFVGDLQHAGRRDLRPADRAAVAEAQGAAARRSTTCWRRRWRRSPTIATRTRSRSRRRCARWRTATACCSRRLSWPSTCATSSAATRTQWLQRRARPARPAIRRRRRSRARRSRARRRRRSAWSRRAQTCTSSSGGDVVSPEAGR